MMDYPILVDETILMSDNKLNAESKLAEAYTVETTTLDKVWKEAGGLTCLMGGVD